MKLGTPGVARHLIEMQWTIIVLLHKFTRLQYMHQRMFWKRERIAKVKKRAMIECGLHERKVKVEKITLSSRLGDSG